MSFEIRPFKNCIESFQKSNPKITLLESKGDHYNTIKAFSFNNLEAWPINPPVNSIYLQDNPLSNNPDILKDPNSLVDYCNFQAVGTFNANGMGKYCLSEDNWLILEVELVQEQADDDFYNEEDYVDVIFAIWRVKEGIVCAIWNPSDKKILSNIIGFQNWPEDNWKICEVWYGE